MRQLLPTIAFVCCLNVSASFPSFRAGGALAGHFDRDKVRGNGLVSTKENLIAGFFSFPFLGFV